MSDRHDAELAAAADAERLGRLKLDEPVPRPAGWDGAGLTPADADVVDEARSRADAAEAAVVTMRALGGVADPTTGEAVPLGATFPAVGTIAMLLAAGGTAELAQEPPWWWTGPTSTRSQALPS